MGAGREVLNGNGLQVPLLVENFRVECALDLDSPGRTQTIVSPNNSSDYKTNYSASLNPLSSNARSDDIFQFPPSKKIKLNDNLNYPQSSTTQKIIDSNFPYDNTNRPQLPINRPISSVS